MKTIEDKEKFIELRAGGMSFAKIAEVIGVSKPTLIKWNLEFNKEIENRRFFAIEALIERYELMQASRIQMFSELLSKATCELKSRDLSLLSFKDLLILTDQMENKLKQEGAMIRYTTDQSRSFWESMEEESGPIKIGLFDQK